MYFKKAFSNTEYPYLVHTTIRQSSFSSRVRTRVVGLGMVSTYRTSKRVVQNEHYLLNQTVESVESVDLRVQSRLVLKIL